MWGPLYLLFVPVKGERTSCAVLTAWSPTSHTSYHLWTPHPPTGGLWVSKEGQQKARVHKRKGARARKPAWLTHTAPGVNIQDGKEVTNDRNSNECEARGTGLEGFPWKGEETGSPIAESNGPFYWGTRNKSIQLNSCLVLESLCSRFRVLGKRRPAWLALDQEMNLQNDII